MGTFSYVVTAEFDTQELADEWVAWLVNGHLRDVLNGGALEASVVRRTPMLYEARYLFADAAAFAAYERDAAPSLRAEGLAKFPASRGVRMSRSSGEIIATQTR
jgi:hypothetical protein